MTAAVVLVAGGLGRPAPAPAAAASASGGAAFEARGSWRWPVRDGAIIAGFRFSAARPFAAGARRGLDIAAPAGAAVSAACAGRVTFAGPVPGGALAVSVRCGGLSATHIGLGRLVVAEGARVRAGGMLGPLGRGGRLRLGARIARLRFGYVNPATLLGAGPGGAPAAPGAPLGRAPSRPAPA
ncbi:MAG: Peptidase family, partial [Solirubrobacteraceae bacterium]|nr:Peptidase family [Solirubrobacteraceae bacterium]